ncbi:hypothetical protein AVEN_174270-1, partial [Araneus ventricosus]
MASTKNWTAKLSQTSRGNSAWARLMSRSTSAAHTSRLSPGFCRLQFDPIKL